MCVHVHTCTCICMQKEPKTQKTTQHKSPLEVVISEFDLRGFKPTIFCARHMPLIVLQYLPPPPFCRGLPPRPLRWSLQRGPEVTLNAAWMRPSNNLVTTSIHHHHHHPPHSHLKVILYTVVLRGLKGI